MPRKPRRNSASTILLDMTAMCDMAFLLLTFFMLSAKFKPDDKIPVVLPASVSEKTLQESHVATFTVTKEGSIYLAYSDDAIKQSLINNIDIKYGLELSDAQKTKFVKMSEIGLKISDFRHALNGDPEKYNHGIPADSTLSDLKDWIQLSRVSEPKIKFAIKGDRQSDFVVVDKLISGLQALEINKFTLITTSAL